MLTGRLQTIKTGLESAGFKPEIRDLASFQDDYGWKAEEGEETDGADEGDEEDDADDDEDEDDEDHGEEADDEKQ